MKRSVGRSKFPRSLPSSIPPLLPSYHPPSRSLLCRHLAISFSLYSSRWYTYMYSIYLSACTVGICRTKHDLFNGINHYFFYLSFLYFFFLFLKFDRTTCPFFLLFSRYFFYLGLQFFNTHIYLIFALVIVFVYFS